MRRFLVLSAFFCCFSAYAQVPVSLLDSIVSSKTDMDDPALFVGVVKDGEIVYQHIRGIASLQHMVPATDSTRCNIASTAKQFTALMILDLVNQGKMSLEDDIRTYFPDLYPQVTDTIRIRHLINHTSGIRDYPDLMGLQGRAWWRRAGLDNEDVIDLLRKQEDLAFSPGSQNEYSNSGYNLLAEVIAMVAEEDFHKYSGRFFRNLGMTETAFLKSYMKLIPNQALPYSDWGDGIWQQYPMLTSTWGEGFLYTTLGDQLRYEQLIQNAEAEGNELLIQSQLPIPNARRTSYGYGVRLTENLNYPAVHHDGGTGSYNSQMVRYPEEKLSIFVMSSNSNVWSGGLADEISQVFLPVKEIVPVYAAGLETVSSDAFSSNIQGQYRTSTNLLIRIEEEEGKFYWKRANRYSLGLTREGENLFHTDYDEQLKIGYFGDKVILYYPSGDTTIYTKLSIPAPTLADYHSYVGNYMSKELDVHFSLSLEENDLMMHRDGWENPRKVEILNRNDLLVRQYVLEVKRDEFDRVVGISLSYARALNNHFGKTSNLTFQPTIATEDGSISVTTVGSVSGDASDIILTRNLPNGNEIWSQQFGGTSYDKASSIIRTNDGYLIIGSTSSYGNGNYDMFVIKTDERGKKEWQHTYGDRMNEYGYTAEITPTGYLIKGTRQECVDGDVFDCVNYVWQVSIDQKGNELSRQILEER